MKTCQNAISKQKEYEKSEVSKKLKHENIIVNHCSDM